jgi:pantoate--beta-alanine ligase
MGYLHQGHLSLVRRARDLANSVWVSIFVNPTQFGPDEDLDRYPRDLERDLELLVAEDVDVVFAPSAAEMYPFSPVVEVGFSGLEKLLCGIDRPGHFAGVGLVVAKLLNIVQPQVAVFGQKDAQQALLIRRLVDDLSFPVQIEVAPTVREPDGLAMSSRNAYLKPEERAVAPLLYQTLVKARDAALGGEQSRRRVETLMQEMIAAEPLFKLEYAECRSQVDLSQPETISGSMRLAVAARIGSTRLIDNIPVAPA